MIESKKSYVKNAANEEQVKSAREKERGRKELDLRDLAWVLSMPQGRRFLWRQLSECGIYKSSFTGSSETFFLEGRRDVGLKLLADITDSDPDSYLRMLKESKERELNNE